MTTNIFDANKAVMATDSRWSMEYGQYLLYLDDTGYEKILRFNGVSLMFAGNGPKIQEFKDWIRSSPVDDTNMPETKGISVCMVSDVSKQVEFKKHQDIEANNVLCAGSGARPAYSCWTTNKCSRRAVETAKSKDHFSGGEVKFIDFVNNLSNLTSFNAEKQLTIQQVGQNIIDRGISMKIQTVTTGTPDLPLPKAAGEAASDAANDEQVARQEMAKLFASGQLSATAPCDGMHNEWSQDDKNDFKRALGKMFGWK